MKGWFVDRSTGRPIYFGERKNKKKLDDAGHPFILDPMVPGLHDPSIGRFAKWAGDRWERDSVAEQEYQDRQLERNTFRLDAIAAYKNLNTAVEDPATPWPDVVTRQLAKNIRDMMKYIGSQLND